MSRDVTQQAAATVLPGDASAPAIEMIDLCKDFGTVRAVDHLTLTVQRGEILGCWGRTDRGKQQLSIWLVGSVYLQAAKSE